MTTIHLRRDEVEAVIDPDLGGSVLRLRAAGRDLLRPAPDGADDVLATASFPLIPFANRIADGILRDGDARVQLPADPAAPPHAHHGHGWRAHWAVAEREEAHAMLTLDRPADAWPWAYRATQRFALVPGGLAITVTVRNDDPSRAMPAGAGIHPYFARHPGSSITARAATMWRNDARGVAVEPLADHRFRGEAVAVGTLEGTDHFFEAADPSLVIDGGDGGPITLAGDGAGFHVYVPAGEPFFCVEPVSHAPNSFGRGDYAAGDRIAPGAERRWSFRITAAPR